MYRAPPAAPESQVRSSGRGPVAAGPRARRSPWAAPVLALAAGPFPLRSATREWDACPRSPRSDRAFARQRSPRPWMLPGENQELSSRRLPFRRVDRRGSWCGRNTRGAGCLGGIGANLLAPLDRPPYARRVHIPPRVREQRISQEGGQRVEPGPSMEHTIEIVVHPSQRESDALLRRLTSRIAEH